MMQHGRRLSEKEYERRIVALHSGLPPSPDRETCERIQRSELDLTIDFRLGVDFPRERREALWHIQRQIEGRRARLFIHWVLGLFSYRRLHGRATKLAKGVVDEYGKVLTRPELEAFFGQEEVESPSLPWDDPR